ncbi:MAG: ABC transporter permease [Erysipelotrichaceae bacterium]|nr:ABC transporter permease [Erysipelotrichaceae bacterium]
MFGEIWTIISTAFTTTEFYTMIIESTAPILLAALGCAVAAKANAVNMGIEGIMTLSALVAVLVSSALGAGTLGPWVGFIAAVAVGCLLGFLVSVFAFRLKIDIILVGIAMNLICTGASVFLMFSLTGDRTTTTSLISGKLPVVNIPIIDKIPILGTIISGRYILTYVAFLLVAALSFLLFKTKLGLRIRAVGENENAAESVGISSLKIKTIALILSGAFGGLAGAFMSECYLAYFSSGLIAGRGFIGLAACTMGSANPGIICLCCIAFGIFYAISMFSKSIKLLVVSSYALEALPYFVVLVGVVIYSIYTRKKELERLRGLDSEEKTDSANA